MNKRIEYIDIFRSVGISLMVLGHVLKYGLLRHFIYAFHMPMFFFISGFLFKHKSKDELSNKDFFIKKFKSLIIPYLFFGLLGYVCYLIKIECSIEPIKHLFFINDKGIFFTGAIWFLSALFFADIIFFFIDRYLKNDIFKFILIFIISMFGCFHSAILHYHLPFSLGQACVGVGFMYIGYLIKINKEKLNFMLNMSNIPLFICAVIFAFLILKNGRISVFSENYWKVKYLFPLFWINATAYSIIILNYSKKFYNKFGLTKFSNILCNIGLNSIIYVGLNYTILSCIVRPILKNFSLNHNIIYALEFFITMIIVYIISNIIMNTKLKVLVGKF